MLNMCLSSKQYSKVKTKVVFLAKGTCCVKINSWTQRTSDDSRPLGKLPELIFSKLNVVLLLPSFEIHK